MVHMKEVSSGWSAPRLMFTTPSFRWGASLALPPAVAGLAASSYAGMATVNMIWRLGFGSDAPGIIFAVGGIFYGLMFGVAFQCLLLGTISNIAWRVGLFRLEHITKKMSRLTKAAIWVLMEIMVIPLSIILTTAVYGGPALLTWVLDSR
jgi:hypothetical protein